MESITYIEQLLNGRWRVYSKSRKNLGTFSSKKLAKRRAAQFERFVRSRYSPSLASSYFRQVKLAKIVKEFPKELSNLTYSSTLRILRKDHPDSVKKFMQTFKEAFDAAIIAGLDDLEETALLETFQKLNLDLK